jgi:hypothetical protein
MKYFLIFYLLFSASLLYAQNPIVRHNMQVIQGGNPSRCNSSWNGRGGQENVVRYGFAQGRDTTGPTIRSCVGCVMIRVKNQGSACVCRTCYDYFQ